MLEVQNVVTVQCRKLAFDCKMLFMLLTILGVRCFRLPQFNSLFGHTKYTSNMAAQFNAQFSDLTSPDEKERGFAGVFLCAELFHRSVECSRLCYSYRQRHRRHH